VDPLHQVLCWHPDTIEWQEVASDGTRYTLLEGNRDVAGGLFSYAFFLPAGFWDPPHWHSTSSRIFVASGVLQLGTGREFKRSEAFSYATGSVLLIPAGLKHFDGSLEDTLIIGVASGPWRTNYVASDEIAG
jgi:quercetin dioxygenase-like cupin family protein